MSGLAMGWYVTTQEKATVQTMVSGPYSSRRDAQAARTSIEARDHVTYWIAEVADPGVEVPLAALDKLRTHLKEVTGTVATGPQAVRWYDVVAEFLREVDR
jgi:hypothetical protein